MPKKKTRPTRAKPPRRAPVAVVPSLPEAKPSPSPKETPTPLVASLEKRPLAPEDHAPLERFAEVVVFSTLFTAGIAALLFLLGIPASTLLSLTIILWLALTAAWLYHRKRQRA